MIVFDRFCRNAQQLPLGGFGVGDKAKAEHLAGAGYVGQPLGNHTAGAAFGGGGVQTALTQGAHDGVFQGGYVDIIRSIAQNILELCQPRVAGGFCFGSVGGAGGHADLALAGFAVDGCRGVGALKQRPHLAGNGAFAAQHAQSAAVDGAVLALFQQRAHLLCPHRLHLPWDAGHQHRAVTVVLKPGAGGGAVVVKDLMPLGGNHRLFAVVRGGAAVGAGKKVQNFLPFGFIKLQGVAKGFCHGFFGQIILGGSQPAGKYQQIAALLCLQNQRAQAVGVIPDDVLVQHTDAQLRQLAA